LFPVILLKIELAYFFFASIYENFNANFIVAITEAPANTPKLNTPAVITAKAAVTNSYFFCLSNFSISFFNSFYYF
jgi:hypothetical protein